MHMKQLETYSRAVCNPKQHVDVIQILSGEKPKQGVVRLGLIRK